jgi:hypothetical protein
MRAVWRKGDFGPLPEGELDAEQRSLIGEATRAARDEADRTGVPHSVWMFPSGMLLPAPSEADLPAVRLDDLRA